MRSYLRLAMEVAQVPTNSIAAMQATATLALAEETRVGNLLALAALYPADSGTRADLMTQARNAMES